MNHLKNLFALNLILTFTSCASIIDGSSQVVSVNSNVEGAQVYINEKMVGQTPFNGKIKKSNDTQIRVKKEGYESKTLTMSTSLPTAFWGNFISGGLFGSTTDFASGAAYEYTPNNYFLHLDKKDATQEETAQTEKRKRVTKFVLINHKQLVKEISKQDGEYLEALIKLKNKQETRESFVKTLRSMDFANLKATKMAKRINQI